MDQLAFQDITSESDNADIALSFDSSPIISLAMLHNSIRPVTNVQVTNSGPGLTAAEVVVSVRDDEGVISRPSPTIVDLPAGATVRLDEVDVQMDASQILDLEERRPATLVVSVVAAGDVVAEQSRAVTVLAGRQWLSRPQGLAIELLAAHVMPNSPIVEELLSEASALLKDKTGSPSIEGYQSGAERADQIAEAIFEAMKARHIRYANPPASWSEDGQKVRTPDEVLEGRVGTCLDTTVVLAAALEQAGLHPLVWVVHGHSFLGYWREDTMSLDAIATSDGSPMVNLVDLDLLRVIETTHVTSPDGSFAQATTTALTRARQVDEVVGILDVRVARRNGIVALPSRRRLPTGEQQVINYEAHVHSTPMPQLSRRDAATSESASADGRQPVPERVQRWKNSLLDLSLRNRLINFTGRYAVELVVPDGHLGAVEDLIHDGRKVTLRASDDVDGVHAARGIRWGRDLPSEHLHEQLASRLAVYTDITTQTYATRLRNLAYKARTIEEETGANNLYLAMGALVWQLDGRKLRTPLILVPVKLVATGRGERTTYRLQLDEAGGSTPNYCLLEKIKQTHGLVIPELATPKEDLSGIDLEGTLNAVRAALATKGLPFHVEDTAHLAILQFAKFRLWKDLDDNWEALLESPLARHLAYTPTEPFADPVAPPEGDVDLDELAALCPIPADSSQLRAISEAVRGRTFVIEGPPGTGKSQTITNLLARNLAEGKRVLFVAEKRAALDVVRSRLDALGLDPFSLDLHDKGSRPAAVRAQLKAALEHRAVVDREGLEVAGEELRTAGRSLSRYRSNLHVTNAANLSLYSAHTRGLLLSDVQRALPVPPSLLAEGNEERLKELRSLLVRLPDVAMAARPKAVHPWGFVQANAEDAGAWSTVTAAVAQIDDAVRGLPGDGPLSAAIRAATTPGELDALRRLAAAQRAPLQLLDETRTTRWQSATGGLRAEVAAFSAAAHPGLDVATPAAVDLPLADIHARAKIASESSWFGRKKRLRAVLEELRPSLKPGAEVPPNSVLELSGALLQVQSTVRVLASRAGQIPGLSVPDSWNPLTDGGRDLLNSQVAWLDWAGAQVGDSPGEGGGFVGALREFVRSGQPVRPETVRALQALVGGLRDLETHLGVTDQAWQSWCADVGLVPRWQTTEAERGTADPKLASLTRWLEFRRVLQPLADAGMQEAHALLLTGAVGAEEASRAFDRGLADASIHERQVSRGLDVFDALSHGRTINRFTRSATAVRSLLPGQIQQQIVDHRPFTSGMTVGNIGRLQRELERRRGGLAVRPLLETYGEIITKLMPCVLVSPDSLARFFPVRGDLFDLVVFDEASQIRVADAIGAIGRATSVVVVGDSKQMPPTSFAESTIVADEDEEEIVGASMVVEDQESILSESVQARLPRHWLSWHYRSQDESLIAFSNKHYYLGKLSSFPAPTTGSADPGVHGYGVSLVRVNGTFHREGKGKLLRTNPVEAEAIVADLVRRLDAHRGEGFPSVGVVTFNQQQRAYIEALIRDHEDNRLAAALDSSEEEGLFIKNLENVQGDERDVILFSTAFSVNARGVLPLNFGPLNRDGGERRLNVAITRARRQVVIYSSFDPAQLRAEETSSEGIKHLRAYLDLAQHGTASLADEIRRAGETDRHREDLADALRQRGIHVTTDLGLSDFRVDLALSTRQEPDRRLVAVILDGASWAQRGTVGDRDGLPVTVLGGMLGWAAVSRVWLPAWLQDRDRVLDQLADALKIAAETTASGIPDEPESVLDLPRSEAVESAWDDVEVDPAPVGLIAAAPAPMTEAVPMPTRDADSQPATGLPGEVPFVPWQPTVAGPRSVLDALPSAGSRREVGAVIQDIVAAEGPVHETRLARLVAASFDLSRVNDDRKKSILRCVPAGWRAPDETEVVRDSAMDLNAWSAFRSDPDGMRDVEQVPLREIANAMRALCQATGGLAGEELLREALEVFGYVRMTVRIAARMDKARIFAVSHALIKLNGDHYQALTT